MACLAAVYGAELGRGTWAETEPLLMIRPPCGRWPFMILNASCVHKNAPVRFVSRTARHWSQLRSSMGMAGALIPALLNSKSKRAKWSSVLANKARTLAGSVTSAHTTSAREPAFPASFTVDSSLSTRRPASTTAYPWLRRAMEARRPIPEPAPVTIATFAGGFTSYFSIAQRAASTPNIDCYDHYTMKFGALQKLRQKLAADQPVYGVWITLESPSLSEMAVALGLDWLVIDAEHGHLDWKEILEHIRAAVRSDTVVLVRISELNISLVKRTLDIGADGIVIPWIENVSQLKEALSYALYPPQGIRGIGGERATGWGQCLLEYTRQANEQVLVVPIVETVKTGRNIRDLCAVDGIELFFFGPADYSST